MAAAAKPRQLDGYVGFASLPNQVYRKAVKKGFEFTLMVRRQNSPKSGKKLYKSGMLLICSQI